MLNSRVLCHSVVLFKCRSACDTPEVVLCSTAACESPPEDIRCAALGFRLIGHLAPSARLCHAILTAQHKDKLQQGHEASASRHKEALCASSRKSICPGKYLTLRLILEPRADSEMRLARPLQSKICCEVLEKRKFRMNNSCNSDCVSTNQAVSVIVSTSLADRELRFEFTSCLI